VFGLVHAYLVWYGDILHHYALLGFVLILFRRRSPRLILAFGIALGVVLPALVVMVNAYGAPPIAPAGTPPPSPEIAARFEAFTSRSYRALLRENAAFALGFWMSGFALQLLPAILGKFLLGFYAGQRRWLQDFDSHLALFRSMLVWGLVFGLLGNALWVWTEKLTHAGAASESSPWVMAAQLPIYAGLIAMAGFYLSAIVLLWRAPAWRARLARLGPVGRMALTNYLTHSVIYLAVFSGFGLALLGRVGTTFCLILSLIVFAAQAVFSAWWLRHFAYGPAEWVWRSLTYATLQPMRLSPAGAGDSSH
jgi:uncharacterized protein